MLSTTQSIESAGLAVYRLVMGYFTTVESYLREGLSASMTANVLMSVRKQSLSNRAVSLGTQNDDNILCEAQDALGVHFGGRRG